MRAGSRHALLLYRLTALVLIGLLACAQAAELTPLESQKIQYLIAAVEGLSGAEFVRNGTGYPAKEAANHLRLKLKNAGSRVRTAEDFIRNCASVSSVSGKPYQIRFSDGHVVTAEAFLRQKLTEFPEP